MNRTQFILTLCCALLLAALPGHGAGVRLSPSSISRSELLATRQPGGLQSVARQWNEEVLNAIRNDLARPTVHARNLFHVSAAMYDAWAAFDPVAVGYRVREKHASNSPREARNEAISFAAYRLLRWRFAGSVAAQDTLDRLDARMDALGYDRAITTVGGSSAAALGNRIAAAYISYGLSDGANEAGGYASTDYEPVNDPMFPSLPGNADLLDPNRWQPLSFEEFIDQSGNPFGAVTPKFLGPEWGKVKPFSLGADDLEIYQRDGVDWWVYLDPGPPPLIGGDRQDEYLDDFQQVVERSGELDPADGVLLDISPASRGNNTLGTNDGTGRALNPTTGQPYAPEIVPAGDYFRVLAEFWADGPSSETPPGHWFTIANHVADDPQLEKRLGGVGPVVDDLEWDIKVYFALGGALHDCAVAAWGVKGWYDFIRPISALRWLASVGQRSDPSLPRYDPRGVRLVPGKVELITAETIQPGGRHAHLRTPFDSHINDIAVRAWRGPSFVFDPATDTAGVGWILLEAWWPYQRPSFVTPPFAGYVSGHSTFSRAAAEVLTAITGDPYFPGGVGEFFAAKNQFLVFEDGPSVDVRLQWATYRDASDETSISRIYGGIHPRADDIPGRFLGARIGPKAVDFADTYFDGRAAATGCSASETTHCLLDGRYQVEVTWRDFQGKTGVGKTVANPSADSGLFWFFQPSNWELMVKVLDGCPINQRVWVFSAATTNVEYTLRVTDSVTGVTVRYDNPLGRASAAITDTSAFASCP